MNHTGTSLQLLPSLLELHKNGRPPFLVRNLRYVHDAKQLTKQRMWSLDWASSDYRSANGSRHLVLSVRPSQCFLEPDVSASFLFFGAPPPSGSPFIASTAREAMLRVTMCVKQEDGHRISFGYRDMKLRFWLRQQEKQVQTGTLQLDDFSITEHFDISTVLPILGADSSALVLIVELCPRDQITNPEAAPKILLRGEVIVWEAGKSKHGRAVANGSVQVPLYHWRKDDNPSLVTSTDVDDTVFALGAVSLEEAVAVNDDISRDEQNPIFPSDGQSSTKADRKGSACVTLEIVGSVQKTISKAVEALKENKPCISISLQYTSPDVPSWDGIERTDFVCPWCHRNCHRYSALIYHFFYEHDEMKFSMLGASDTQSADGGDKTKAHFVLKFSVRRMDVPQQDDVGLVKRKKIESGENIRDDPRYPFIYTSPRLRGSVEPPSSPSIDDDEGHPNKNVVEARSSENDESCASTECDEDKGGVKIPLAERVRKLCVCCWRPHNRSYDKNGKYCSEWCEISCKAKQKEGGMKDSGEDMLPLATLASIPRAKKINYKEQLGHLKLYHVVSVSEAKEEDFDEEDPDSEEEVDQSWRMELSMERVRHLEGVSAKEKVLWMMWNEFAHEQYPLPCLYAERYTRYTLEWFALEYKVRIDRCKLRLQFLGFLRALHVHGMIDTVAIKSIMMCLNGLKKRREIMQSARPELPGDIPGVKTKKNIGKYKRGFKKA